MLPHPSLASRLLRRLPLAAALGLIIALPLALRAVVVSPTAVFMSDAERATQVTLFNSTTTPEEITMELRYGYPDTDSAGAVVYRLLDSAAAGDPSATRFVALYPRRIVLAPGARQIVRLVATPPADLADGEYWGRFVIKSNPRTVLDVTGADPGVRAGLQLEMRTVIPVLYRRGVVRTEVEIPSITAQRLADSVIVRAVIARRGNAAFLGNALLELRDSTGSVRSAQRTTVAIHLDQNRRFVMPLPPHLRAQSRGFSVRLTLSADRRDLPATKILHTQPVSAIAPVAPAA